MYENEIMNKDVLLLLSGGRDSFLAACKLLTAGYSIHMITYDNGCMSGTENVLELVERIKKVFGEDNAKFAGIHVIAQNLNQLLYKPLYTEPIELCKEYPHLLKYQVNCLACHTVMYVHSIAYCKAYNIGIIAEGAREQQKFFVELPEMKERYEKLCKEYDIDLVMPVYDLKSDIERKSELSEWGLLPKSFEPQCWMGCPMIKELNAEQRADLASYYDQEIKTLLDPMIDRLINKKKIWNCTEMMGEYV